MKLRILNAGQNYRVIGGSDRYLLDLESLLENKGHKVIPFAASHPDNLPTEWGKYFPDRNDFERPRIKDIAGFVYSISTRKKLESLLAACQIDLAHAHIYYGQLTGALLGVLKKHDIPIVQTLHEYKLVCPVYTLNKNGDNCMDCAGGRFYRGVVNKCNRNSVSRSFLSVVESYVTRWLGSIDKIDRFICVSDYQRDLIIRMGVPDSKLVTIHNFVRPELFRQSLGDGDYVLYFGRLERIKGVFTLLEAAALLPHVPFMIIGKGQDGDELKRYAERRCLKNVRFLDFISGDKLEDIIAQCRFSVLPTEWAETFGLTVLETFMKGRPVIASRIGGVQEVIEDKKTGLFFPPGNCMELASLIEYLWSNPKICREMGEEGQKHALTAFGPDVHYEKLIQVYKQVLGRN